MEGEKISVPISELSPKNPFTKEQKPLQQMEDELNPRQIPILKPLLPSVIMTEVDEDYPPGHPKRNIMFDVTEELKDDFDYFSKTRALEINTPRTQILQDVLNKIMKGENIQTRAVIMTKGADANAFAAPDGTVFFSQSLLNKLDSLDEVAAISIHELSHLIFKTPYKAHKAQTSAQKFGVNWIHEVASDEKSPQLLEKTGFNSFAFATAISKISGAQRGTIHQSGDMRASQIMIHHMAIDRNTSDTPPTPIPLILKGDVKKTNLELIDEIIAKEPENKAQKAKEYLTQSFEKEIRPGLELLHKKDLEKIYDSYNIFNEMHAKLLNNCENLIMIRLEKHGFSKADSLFFLMTNLRDWSPRQGDLIKTVEEFNAVVENLKTFEDTDKYRRMYKAIFDRSSGVLEKTPGDPPARFFMEVLKKHLYDVNFEKRQNGIPLTGEALINALDKINKLNKSYGSNYDEASLTEVVAKYVAKTYLAQAETDKETVLLDDLKNFFEKFKTKDIELDPKTINELFTQKLSVEYYNKKLSISDENKNIALKAFNEVFNIQGEKEFGFKEIDDFFLKLDVANNSRYTEVSIAEHKTIENYINYLKKQFDRNKLTDQKRLDYINYINQKIDSSDFKNNRPLLKFLENTTYPLWVKLTPEDEITNNQISKFNLKMIMGLGLFEKDGPEFYSYLKEAMDSSGLDPNQLSRTQLINLCQGIFALDSEHIPQPLWYGQNIDTVQIRNPLSLENYDALMSLPFMTKIMEKDQKLSFTNIRDLNTFIKSELENIQMLSYEREKFDLFDDNLRSLVLGRAVRDNFSQILDSGVTQTDYAEFYNFINNYYPKGTQKDQFLKEINKLVLNSPDLSIDDKTNYLITYFDKVGPEGMVIIANEIKDIKIYEKFREKVEKKLAGYLDGSASITALSLADYFTSYMAEDFNYLLQTASTKPETAKNISTNLADAWFFKTLNLFLGPEKELEKNIRAPYDRNKDKFVLNNEKRADFRTFNDLVSTLKNLTQMQKFAMAHKAMLDKGGALTTVENRKILGKSLVDSLELKKGFTSDVLEAACLEVDAKIAGVPASNILAPLLFRAIDADSVDLKKLGGERLISRKRGGEEIDIKLNRLFFDSEISNILRSNTREITVFGPKYQLNPESTAAKLCQESDLKYQQITDKLNSLLKESQTSKEKPDEKTEIDSATEALIKGVEASGALGIRALQLTTQFQKLSPALEKRLSESLDSNPGMNKLMFWENLYKLSQEYPEIKSFLERVTLHNYLGGGSLQTTYGATYKDEAGNEKNVIVKMKNPNVAAFIRETYSSAYKTLESVGGDNARTGMALMELAQKWCLDDINDTTFIKDDDLFRQTITKYNLQKRSDQFYAPERTLTHNKLKSEDLAPGKTVNKLLNDPNVNPETKKEIVQMLSKFFVYQFRGNSFTNDHGKNYFLIHSDPHIGNYIADTSGDKPKIGVIDRSLYLKLEDKDVHVLEKLMVKGNNTEFADSFIDRILEVNKVRGIQKTYIKNKVFARVAVETLSQMARGGVNRFELMRTMLTELSNSKMDIPLNLRLMIRNIGAFQELTKKYGVDFEQINQPNASQ